MLSALRARRDQLAQHFRAATRTWWRLRIAHDHLGPSMRRGHVAGFPCRERQNLARAVPERPVGSGQRFQPLQNLRIRSGVNQQETATHRREVLHNLADAVVSGDRIVIRDSGFAIGRCKLRGLTQTREHAVSRRAITREFCKSCRRLLMLARFGKCDRLLERGAGLSGLLGLPPLVTTPSADADHDGNAGRNEIAAVTLPQLFELFAADFLIDFLEYVAHAIALNACALNAWLQNPAAVRVVRSGSNSLCHRAVR